VGRWILIWLMKMRSIGDKMASNFLLSYLFDVRIAGEVGCLGMMEYVLSYRVDAYAY
jgi:hypothetical protein